MAGAGYLGTAPQQPFVIDDRERNTRDAKQLSTGSHDFRDLPALGAAA